MLKDSVHLHEPRKPVALSHSHVCIAAGLSGEYNAGDRWSPVCCTLWQMGCCMQQCRGRAPRDGHRGRPRRRDAEVAKGGEDQAGGAERLQRPPRGADDLLGVVADVGACEQQGGELPEAAAPHVVADAAEAHEDHAHVPLLQAHQQGLFQVREVTVELDRAAKDEHHGRAGPHRPAMGCSLPAGVAIHPKGHRTRVDGGQNVPILHPAAVPSNLHGWQHSRRVFVPRASDLQAGGLRALPRQPREPGAAGPGEPP
mmetsp:Transcript_149379/g.479737  ORF Transcript_149379/g.479737 Transcript_149379/m.479737 type:complete len:256 (-) Transcript_149379:1569-2336(-)